MIHQTWHLFITKANKCHYLYITELSSSLETFTQPRSPPLIYVFKRSNSNGMKPKSGTPHPPNPSIFSASFTSLKYPYQYDFPYSTTSTATLHLPTPHLCLHASQLSTESFKLDFILGGKIWNCENK